MKSEFYTSDEAILTELGKLLADRRIGMELTQVELSRQAGIGKRTVERIEAGHSCQTTALIRVLRILELQDRLKNLVPPFVPSPMDLLRAKGKSRKQASSGRRYMPGLDKQSQSKAAQSDGQEKQWMWGDEDA